MADYTLKQGDLEPSVTGFLVDSTGLPVNLATATNVAFRMMGVLNHVEAFSRPAVIDDAVGGELSYPWQPGDTDLPGVFYAEFVVTWPIGRPQTYPPGGYLTIAINPKA